ncbi:hypothetical protein [Silicimonas sp. MF1-12-2]|uniref:hypothetical protein n=1 Tax=Silicimonas sp. MF1-12-2 TaxID=3384793 RepID=UPI0039B6BACE
MIAAVKEDGIAVVGADLGRVHHAAHDAVAGAETLDPDVFLKAGIVVFGAAFGERILGDADLAGWIAALGQAAVRQL